ncbi:MAG: putative acetyltransferase YhhY [Bacteroidetes bacterium ADurb.Bin217]|nr:MAG: putative acetyltransferase YhhY [Bacteroidetes bacterium ADurb.Bin217]
MISSCNLINIELKEFQQSDFDRLIQWVHTEEEMVQWSGPLFRFPITHQQLEDYIHAEHRLVFSVADIHTSQIIGHAEINAIDTVQKSARICRVLVGDEHHRNKGYGTQIIQELVRYAFETVHLNTLDLAVYDFNVHAIACYKKCGFEIISYSKNNCKVGESYWSTYTMRMQKQR